MNTLKKTMFVALAVATMSTAGVSFTTAPASATHYGYGNHHQQRYQAPKRCHWGWVRWKNNYGHWQRQWKQICK